MTSPLWIAKTGLDAQQMRMSVITNNLANVSTTGFKRGRAQFEDLLYQNVRQVDSQTSQNTTLPSGLSLGAGVRITSTAKIVTQGNLTQTGNALDLAINGRGFFQVLLPDGATAYTRAGAFQVNADGQVVTANGYLLQPEITICTQQMQPHNQDLISIYLHCRKLVKREDCLVELKHIILSTMPMCISSALNLLMLPSEQPVVTWQPG